MWGYKINQSYKFDVATFFTYLSHILIYIKVWHIKMLPGPYHMWFLLLVRFILPIQGLGNRNDLLPLCYSTDISSDKILPHQ